MAAPWDEVDGNHGMILPAQPHENNVKQSRVYILLIVPTGTSNLSRKLFSHPS